MTKIQQLLQEDNKATLHQIFNKLEPGLAQCYHDLRTSKPHIPIADKVLDLYADLNEQGSSKEFHETKVEWRGKMHRMYTVLVYEANREENRSLTKISVAECVVQLLLRIEPERIDTMLDSGMFSHKKMPVPLPDSTHLLHDMLNASKLTCKFLLFLIQQGADVTQANSDGLYPIHLALKSAPLWVVDLVDILVTEGSPTDKPCDGGSVQELVDQYITDAQTKDQLNVILSRVHRRSTLNDLLRSGLPPASPKSK